MKTLNNFQKGVGIVLFLVQLFDIVIHAASGQLEPMRVTSNLIMIVWLAIIAFGRSTGENLTAALISIGGYLGLNIIFLALEGLTNPNTRAPRVTLFLLVFLTTALSSVFYFQMKSNRV